MADTSMRFTEEQNPHGVKPGQTWQKQNGDQFDVLYLEWWSVRGVEQPSARVVTRRPNNRGLKHGFDDCTLITDAPEADT